MKKKENAYLDPTISLIYYYEGHVCYKNIAADSKKGKVILLIAPKHKQACQVRNTKRVL